MFRRFALAVAVGAMVSTPKPATAQTSTQLVWFEDDRRAHSADAAIQYTIEYWASRLLNAARSSDASVSAQLVRNPNAKQAAVWAASRRAPNDLFTPVAMALATAVYSKGAERIASAGGGNIPLTLDDLAALASAAPVFVFATPEPSTWSLVATGLVGIGALRRRRRNA